MEYANSSLVYGPQIQPFGPLPPLVPPDPPQAPPPLVPFLLLCLLLYVLLSYLLFLHLSESGYRRPLPGRRLLLVTAHPDDECMFFGPLLTLTSQSQSHDIYLLCLSDGGYDGVGSMRKQELWAACVVLGLKPSNMSLLRHELLPDHPRLLWSPHILADILLRSIETLAIDTLVTFDSYGVSGHNNHISIYQALLRLRTDCLLPSYCRLFLLQSVSLFRKYSLCLELLFSHLTASYLYPSSLECRWRIKEAMSKHSSQLVWYRRLYLIFSRYLYINTFKEIT